MPLLRTPEQAVQWLRSTGATGLNSDSRHLDVGDAFVAWPGAGNDPRRFVAAALRSGARACLVEEAGAHVFGFDEQTVGTYPGLKADCGAIAADFYGAPSHELAVIAVTGTNGKTSTAYWLAQAFDAVQTGMAAMPCGVIGTLGVGRVSALIPTGLTTPDPVLLQKALRTMVLDGAKACAVEASSIGIEEQRLQSTRIRIAVFTNFTQDHLDYHGSMAAYWAAKRKLFVWEGLQSAVINIDDAQGTELAADLRQKGQLDLWTVAVLRPARLRAQNLHYNPQGLAFDVVEGEHAVRLQTRVIGDYNASNVLGVIAAMRSMGIDLDTAVQACGMLTPVPGRMECVGGTASPLVAVDYAHSPDALAQALRALRTVATARGGRLWCVFGCGGDRDATKRPLMGAVAAAQADCVVVTSDNPRSEKPEAIVAQIMQGMVGCATAYVYVDRAQAIAYAIAQATADDVVLLAGKGHENTQDIGGVKMVFSDLAHAQTALRARVQEPQA